MADNLLQGLRTPAEQGAPAQDRIALIQGLEESLRHMRSQIRILTEKMYKLELDLQLLRISERGGGHG